MEPDHTLVEPPGSTEQAPGESRLLPVTLLALALPALWITPLGVLALWPNSDAAGGFYVSLVSGLAVVLAIWTVHGVGRLVVRSVESVAGASAALWCSNAVLELLGLVDPIRQETAALVGALWACVWLAATLLLGFLHLMGIRLFPPPPETDAPAVLQFSLHELLRLTALVAVLFAVVTRAAAIPYVGGWFSGWGMWIFAPMLLFLYGNIVPILIVGGLAIWAAHRLVYWPLAGLLAFFTGVIYVRILSSFGSFPEALGTMICGVVYFAFTWCGARLIYVCKDCGAAAAE